MIDLLTVKLLNMETDCSKTFIMVPAEEFLALKSTLALILSEISALKVGGAQAVPHADYIPASEFMKLTNMKKSKFYDMIGHNKIRVIRKLRKTYVLASEVKRYFIDPEMS